MLKFHVIGRELPRILMLETFNHPAKFHDWKFSTQNLWKQISAAPGFKPAYNPYTEPSMEVFGILA